MKSGDPMKNKGVMVKWFLPYFKKHKKVLFLDLFCAALTTGAELILPMMVREITNIATTDISKLTLELICRWRQFMLFSK